MMKVPPLATFDLQFRFSYSRTILLIKDIYWFSRLDADEKSFLIGVELCLRSYPFEGRYAVSWRDVQAAEPDDRFEFVSDTGTSKETRNFVEHTILRAVYERKYMRSSSGVSNRELKALAYEYVVMPSVLLSGSS